jgi:hypothetical protein
MSAMGGFGGFNGFSMSPFGGFGMQSGLCNYMMGGFGGMNMGMGMNTGMGMNLGLNIGMGANSGMGMNMGIGMNMGMGMNTGMGMGAYNGFGFGGFGGGYQGLGGMMGMYMGGNAYPQPAYQQPMYHQPMYHQPMYHPPIYDKFPNSGNLPPVGNEPPAISKEPQYKTVIEKEAVTTNNPGKMWDVYFDHQDGKTPKRLSPIVLDLNGDGKAGITGKNITGDGKITGPTTMFDLDPTRDSYEFSSKNRRPGKGAPAGGVMKDGLYQWGKKEPKEKTEWLAKNGGDGFLVWDNDKDGKITSSKELFGEFDVDGKKKFKDGYDKLGHYFDANKDGIVKGDELKGLNIWKDANADGITQAGELQNLSDHGITSLDISKINRSDMSSTFNRETTTYREVEKKIPVE